MIRTVQHKALILGSQSRWANSAALRVQQLHTTATAATELPTYTTLLLTRPSEHVVHVQLNRPKRSNAMNRDFWREIRECFSALSHDHECRAVLLTGAGKNFTSGLDLQDAAEDLFSMDSEDASRRAFQLRKLILDYQQSFTAIEECSKPVIVAIHGACIGGGIDLITACDIRYCAADSVFSIKEVDIGLAADVGTLQRLPKIVGNDSLIRELAYTGRNFDAQEALSFGLVSRVLPDITTLHATALDLTTMISKKSPVAVVGTKHNLNYSRDHPTKESLNYMATWNQAMLQTVDIGVCVAAAMDKTSPPPVFSKL